MNELKFNSAICTTKEQSERLLKLGLNPETADMHYHEGSEDGAGNIEFHCNIRTECNNILFPDYIPAWSLYRLIEMCGIDRMPISFHKKGKIRIRVNHIHPTHEGRSGYNYYNSLIDCIEWLISENYFNKEYLKQ